MEEKTTQITPSSNKNKIWMIGGAVALLAIAAVIIVLVLISNAQNTSSSLTALDPGNPEAATQLLNDTVRDIAIASSTGDANALVNAFAEIGQISSAEFSMDLSIASGGGLLELTLEGKSKGTSASDSQSVFAINIVGSSPEYGFDLQVPATIDFIALPDTVYFRIVNLFDQLQEGQTLAFSYLGIEEDQWYSLANTAAAGTTESPASISSLNPVQLGTLQESLKELSDKPLFINSTAASPRTVGGVEIPCMNTQLNPEAGQTTSEFEAFPLEICANPGSFLPAFLGFSSSEDGAEFDFGLSITSLNTEFNISAPEGAIDFNEMLENLYSPDSFTQQDYNLEDYDFDYDSLDLY